MTWPDRYDLLLILAGDKPVRHRAAVELLRRGWADQIVVTGEHEHIETGADGVPAERVLAAPPSRSTAEDARSLRVLVERHRLGSVLVVTSASQVGRARLVFRRLLRDLPVRVDVLAWEAGPGPSAFRVLRDQSAELLKTGYYALRGRV